MISNPHIFGSGTKLSNEEQKIIDVLMKYNDAIYAIKDSKGFNILTRNPLDTEKNQKEKRKTKLKNGTIIPLDIQIAKQPEFFSQKVIEELKYKNINLNDFIFLKTKENTLIIEPQDIKESFDAIFKNKSKLGQISPQNTAYLIQNSPYLQKAIITTLQKNKKINKIEIKGGNFILTKKQKQKQDPNLNKYLKSYFELKNISGGLNLEEDIPFIDKTQKKKLKTKKSISIQKMSYTTYKNQIREIKNTIRRQGFYNSEIIVIDSFQDELPRIRFNYQPQKFIESTMPELELMKKNLLETHALNYTEMSYKAQLEELNKFLKNVNRRKREIKKSLSADKAFINKYKKYFPEFIEEKLKKLKSTYELNELEILQLNKHIKGNETTLKEQISEEERKKLETELNNETGLKSTVRNLTSKNKELERLIKFEEIKINKQNKIKIKYQNAILNKKTLSKKRKKILQNKQRAEEPFLSSIQKLSEQSETLESRLNEINNIIYFNDKKTALKELNLTLDIAQQKKYLKKTYEQLTIKQNELQTLKLELQNRQKKRKKESESITKKEIAIKKELANIKSSKKYTLIINETRKIEKLENKIKTYTNNLDRIQNQEKEADLNIIEINKNTELLQNKYIKLNEEYTTLKDILNREGKNEETKIKLKEQIENIPKQIESLKKERNKKSKKIETIKEKYYNSIDPLRNKIKLNENKLNYDLNTANANLNKLYIKKENVKKTITELETSLEVKQEKHKTREILFELLKKYDGKESELNIIKQKFSTENIENNKTKKLNEHQKIKLEKDSELAVKEISILEDLAQLEKEITDYKKTAQITEKIKLEYNPSKHKKITTNSIKKINNTISKTLKYKNELSLLDSKIEYLEKEIEENNLTKKQKQTIRNKNKRIRKNIQKITEEKNEKIEPLKHNLNTLNSAIHEYNRKKRDLEKELIFYSTKIYTALEHKEQELKKIEENLSKFKNERNTLEITKSNHSNKITEIQKNILSTQNKIEEIKTKETYSNNLNILTKIKKLKELLNSFAEENKTIKEKTQAKKTKLKQQEQNIKKYLNTHSKQETTLKKLTKELNSLKENIHKYSKSSGELEKILIEREKIETKLNLTNKELTTAKCRYNAIRTKYMTKISKNNTYLKYISDTLKSLVHKPIVKYLLHEKKIEKTKLIIAKKEAELKKQNDLYSRTYTFLISRKKDSSNEYQPFNETGNKIIQELTNLRSENIKNLENEIKIKEKKLLKRQAQDMIITKQIKKFAKSCVISYKSGTKDISDKFLKEVKKTKKGNEFEYKINFEIKQNDSDAPRTIYLHLDEETNNQTVYKIDLFNTHTIPIIETKRDEDKPQIIHL